MPAGKGPTIPRYSSMPKRGGLGPSAGKAAKVQRGEKPPRKPIPKSNRLKALRRPPTRPNPPPPAPPPY